MFVEPIRCENFAEFCRVRKGATNSASNAAKSILQFLKWAKTEAAFAEHLQKILQSEDILRSKRQRWKKAIEVERSLRSRMYFLACHFLVIGNSKVFSERSFVADSAAAYAARYEWLEVEQLQELNSCLRTRMARLVEKFIVHRHAKEAWALQARGIDQKEASAEEKQRLMMALKALKKHKRNSKRILKAKSNRQALAEFARQYQRLLCTLLFLSIGCQRRGTLMIMFTDSFERVVKGQLKGWTMFTVSTEKTRRLHGQKVPIHPDVGELLWFWMDEMRPHLLKVAKLQAAARAKVLPIRRGDNGNGEPAERPDPLTMFLDPKTGSWPKLSHLSSWVKETIKLCLGREYNLGPLQLRRILPSLVWEQQLHLEGQSPTAFMEQYASLVNSSGTMLFKHYIRVTDESIYSKVVHQIDEQLFQTPKSRQISADLRRLLNVANAEPDNIILGEAEVESALVSQNEQLELKNAQLLQERQEMASRLQAALAMNARLQKKVERLESKGTQSQDQSKAYADPTSSSSSVEEESESNDSKDQLDSEDWQALTEL